MINIVSKLKQAFKKFGDYIQVAHFHDTKVKELNLSINEKAWLAMRKVMKRERLSSAVELLRRALAVYDLLGECVEEGDTIIVRHPDGKEEVLKLPLPAFKRV